LLSGSAARQIAATATIALAGCWSSSCTKTFFVVAVVDTRTSPFLLRPETVFCVCAGGELLGRTGVEANVEDNA
jgi:hypothetical protein